MGNSYWNPARIPARISKRGIVNHPQLPFRMTARVVEIEY
jgi:hypothetical protein